MSYACDRGRGPLAVVAVLALLLGWQPRRVAQATPPEYATFDRDQQVAPAPAGEDLLRIWVIYVGQGDGILIQLPERFGYDRDPNDPDDKSELLDILVDGGSSPVSDARRATQFIQRLYAPRDPILEYVVLTHHDSDHVKGIEYLLDESTIGVETIFHNGLASYLRGAQFAGATAFPTSGAPLGAIYDGSRTRMTRGMAYWTNDERFLSAPYLINSLSELRSALDARKFQGVYEEFASAVIGRNDPFPVTAFPRSRVDRDFIEEFESQSGRGIDLEDIHFELLWPLDQPRQYNKDWGETINGNSVMFRLVYDEFEMLFTGDHNTDSQQDLIDSYGSTPERLRADVLKVPHHGSDHSLEPFVELVDPVVSVASMGEQGFKSKTMYRGNWEHPSTQVISWLGGSHRVYHTLIQERRFDWEALDTQDEIDDMKEFSHVLIETDGTWFRIVEIPDDASDLSRIPTVEKTRRGNGTRWIRAN